MSALHGAGRVALLFVQPYRRWRAREGRGGKGEETFRRAAEGRDRMAAVPSRSLA